MTKMKTIMVRTVFLALMLPATLTAQDPAAIAEGAQVYSDYCASCHNARASSERTDLEWIAITLHMRARANFSRTEAQAVLAFLQATNLPETVTVTSPGAAPPATEASLGEEWWRVLVEPLRAPAVRVEGGKAPR